jgi:hypothetical protein
MGNKITLSDEEFAEANSLMLEIGDILDGHSVMVCSTALMNSLSAIVFHISKGGDRHTPENMYKGIDHLADVMKSMIDVNWAASDALH